MLTLAVSAAGPATAGTVFGQAELAAAASAARTDSFDPALDVCDPQACAPALRRAVSASPFPGGPGRIGGGAPLPPPSPSDCRNGVCAVGGSLQDVPEPPGWPLLAVAFALAIRARTARRVRPSAARATDGSP